MTDTRRRRAAIEGEREGSGSEARNRSGKPVCDSEGAACEVDDRARPLESEPAAWEGRSSESRVKVPPCEAEQASSRPVRKPKPGDIMTRAEVAALLRCSEPHVVALVEREQLPGFRLGRPWRFRRSEVLAWCERRMNGRRSA
jgi:excisionase family DNA binding protein